MNWQDLLKQRDDDLLTSDDPQAQAAAPGWKQIYQNPEVQKALDFTGNLKAYDDDATAHVKSMTDMLRTGVASNPDADLKMAEHSLGTAMGTIKAAELTPNEKIRQLAQEYMKAKKLPTLPDQPYAKVDQGVAKKIAQAYEEMKHDPENPQVKAAYKALIDETNGQFQKLKESGLKIDKITGENPYKSSADLLKDIKDNNHISYYPTENGFGTNTSTSNHPMLAKSGETINGEEVPANDIFRVVHDYFGHAKEGPGFGPRGEENAFREHAQMYSPEALKALATETRGQNSWVNYGPKGEANRANPANTVFADQKAGLLPDWASEFEKTMATLKPELPIDEISRTARAEEMNINRNYNLYHGTPKGDIQQFKGGSGNTSGLTFLTPDPEFAERFAGKGQGANILPVHTNVENTFNGSDSSSLEKLEKQLIKNGTSEEKARKITSSIQEATDIAANEEGASNWRELELPEVTKAIKDAGFDSIHVVEDGMNNLAVLDSSKIRSKFAAFDPKKKTSGDISSVLAGLGIGGTASQMNEEEKFSSLKKKLGL